MMIRSAAATVIFIGMSNVLTAQENVVREQTGAHIVHFEQHTIARESTNTVIVPFRIRYDFFVFTRSSANSTDPYSARGEAAIELLDSTGLSIARSIQQINITAVENSPISLRSLFIQNFFSFDLGTGRYSIVLRIEDKESKRQFVDDKRQFTVPKPDKMLSGLIPVQDLAGEKFTIFNLGGDVLFSKNYGFVFISEKRYSAATYTLSKLHMDDEEREPIDTLASAAVTSFEDRTLAATLGGDRSVELMFRHGQWSNVNYIVFDGAALRQGRYEMIVTLPDSTKLKTTFGTRWLDMPAPLYDLDLSIEPIQYITTKDEYSDLRSGGRETRIKKFEQFWKKRDTTPSTAYNEVMHEFYRRVEYAMTAFRSLREMNGALTDRGKIYILYGRPTVTERILRPDGAPKEIWKYSSLKKTFTFEDPSKQGNYKLAENK